MDEKVSVIVPIYNVQSYLEQTIQSICQQSYANLEIILVDDGSTDRSLQICEQAQSRDKRIKVLHEQNSGSGPARNYGITAATGNYILFVDGDDFIGPKHIQNLYQSMIKYHSDIACSFYYRQDDDGNYHFFLYDNDPEQQKLEGVYSPEQWIKHNDTSLIGQIFEQSVGKLFKRFIFQNVEYPADSYAEDALTLWKLYLNANRISYINIGDYCWRLRASSATSTQKDNTHYLENIVTAFEQKIALYQNINIVPDFLIHEYLYSLEQANQAAKKYANRTLLASTSFKIAQIKKNR